VDQFAWVKDLTPSSWSFPKYQRKISIWGQHQCTNCSYQIVWWFICGLLHLPAQLSTMQHCLQYRKSGTLALLWALHTCATARSMLVNNWKEHPVKRSRNIIAWVVEKYLNLWFDHENGLPDLSGQISENFIQKYSKKKTLGGNAFGCGAPKDQNIFLVMGYVDRPISNTWELWKQHMNIWQSI